MGPARNAYQVATSASKIVNAAVVIVAGSDSASEVLQDVRYSTTRPSKLISMLCTFNLN